jgi:hypothetical protein
MKVPDYPFLAIAGACYMFLNMLGTVDLGGGKTPIY